MSLPNGAVGWSANLIAAFPGHTHLLLWLRDLLHIKMVIHV